MSKSKASLNKVSIRRKTSSEFKDSLYLDWYDGTGKRKKDYIGLVVFKNPQTVAEKYHNKEVLAKAEILRSNREVQVFHGEIEEVIEQRKVKNRDFRDCFKNYLDSYSQKDIRVMKAVYKHFDDYAPANITVKGITEKFCIDFKTYLEETLNGESPATYFARFKKMLAYVTKYEKLFRESPAKGIENKVNSLSLQKDVLTIEELKKLAKAHCGNEDVKRAFLFSCNTGMRFGDLKALKWKNVKDDQVEFDQNKTKKKSNDNGSLVLNLNNTAKDILAQCKLEKDESDFVFKLPTNGAANKNLANWARRAEIDKHITFHCSRHSFGTLLASYGNDIHMISSLLGHSSLKHTAKYVRLAEKLRKKAVDSLPNMI